MCGIVYISRKDNNNCGKMVMKRYHKQKARGSEGYGFVSFVDDKIKSVKRAQQENEIRTEIKKQQSSEIMFHHRFPTSVPNYPETAHPIYVSNKMLEYDYYLVHNGMISNDDELVKKHEKLGFEYTTKYTQQFTIGKNNYRYDSEVNDSECLAIELALYLEYKQPDIDTQGSMAFIMVQVNKVSKKVINRYCGRNSNPLKAYREKQFFSICSEGGGVEIKAETIFKIEHNALSPTGFKIPSDTMGITWGVRPSWGQGGGKTSICSEDYDDFEKEKNLKKWTTEDWTRYYEKQEADNLNEPLVRSGIELEEEYYRLLSKKEGIEDEIYFLRYKGDRQEEYMLQSELDGVEDKIANLEIQYGFDY